MLCPLYSVFKKIYKAEQEPVEISPCLLSHGDGPSLRGMRAMWILPGKGSLGQHPWAIFGSQLVFISAFSVTFIPDPPRQIR